MVRGIKLRQIRRRMRLTQVQVANIIGISQPMWQQAESNGVAKLSTIKRYASALGIDYKTLLD